MTYFKGHQQDIINYLYSQLRMLKLYILFLFFSGPVTVPMVSTNSSPPVAMPVQVPPGHVVQQIVDESGTLRHVIISPQHPPGVLAITSHNPQHYVSP